MLRLLVGILAVALPATSFANTPPMRLDARLTTMAGDRCVNPNVPRAGTDGAESFTGDTLLPNIAMGVYDALTAALEEAGKDKERISATVLNLSGGQPRCFQVAMQPSEWRSSIMRRRSGDIQVQGVADLTQIENFPFFAEFYIRREGTAITIGASALRYYEPIWRNFQSPANEMVATFVISRPGETNTQTVSVALGGPTRRASNGYHLFQIPTDTTASLNAETRPTSETPWFTSPFIAAPSSRTPNGQTPQVEVRTGGAPGPRATTSTATAAPPRTNNDQAPPPETATHAPPSAASGALPATITIQLRELKDGNPVAALLAGALRNSRTAAAAQVSPSSRAQARAAELTADIGAINAYGNALGAYYTARATYCASDPGTTPTLAQLRTRNPAQLWATHQVLLEYAQRGIGTPPTHPMVDPANPRVEVCQN